MHWIPCSAILPKDHQHVLAWVVGGPLHMGEDYADIAMYLNGIFRVGDHRPDGEPYDCPVSVSHWIPLPHGPDGQVWAPGVVG